MLIPPEDRARLLALGRATLAAAFTDQERAPLLEFESHPENLTSASIAEMPCFVTLTTPQGKLRGCIGSMVSFNPLYKNVFHMTRQAAFEDPRFQRVRAEEAPSLKFHIAVLGPMRPLKSLEELEIGKQGLHVAHGHKRGVLLASVAVDYHFSKEEYLRETCLKAGLDPSKVATYEVKTFDEESFE